jgi:hypothetical protein
MPNRYDPRDAEGIYEAVLRRLVPEPQAGQDRRGEAFVSLPAGNPSSALLERLGDRSQRLRPISDRRRLFGALPDATPIPRDPQSLRAHYYELGPVIREADTVVVRARQSWPMGWQSWRFRLRRDGASGYQILEAKLLGQLDY